MSAISRLGERQQKLLRILLQEREGLTIDQLTERLEVTRTAVRQHLESLEDEAFVARGPARLTGGRPSQIFLITSKGIDLFPKQYSWFSSLMLARMRAEAGSEGLTASLRAMASGVAELVASRIEGESQSERIDRISELMLELGYETLPPQTVPSDSTEKSRLSIVACNCVYHDLAKEHPEICEFDRELLRVLSGTEVEQQECMATGGRACRFAFGKAR